MELLTIICKNPFLHIWCLVSTAAAIYLFVQVRASEGDSEPIKVRRFANSTMDPVGNRNIFFLETRSPSDRVASLNTRQACSIESVSRANPDWNIYLYITDVDYYQVNEIWTIIRLLPNVHVIQIGSVEFAQGTPVEQILRQGLQSKEDWIVAHKSDILRYVLLSKYAGVYSDLDIIALKSFDSLEMNFVAQETDLPLLTIGSAVVGFGDDEVGRKLSQMVLADIADNFTGRIWVESIASLTRGIIKLCNTRLVSNAVPENCEGFKVLPKESFYAIPFFQNDVFFDEFAFMDGLNRLNKSVVSHFWNHMTREKKASKSSKTLLNYLAWKHCPEIFAVTEKYL